MDLTGLLSRIYDAASFIDIGRKGFATKGKAEEGRISFEKGIAQAMSAFQEASKHSGAVSADPETIILAEYTFLSQELEFCHETDKASINSLTQAIQSFDDALLALKIVEEKDLYHVTDKTIPHNKDYRINGFPKDSFHIACISHKTMLKNIIRSPGIDPIEKDLLNQRLTNLPIAQIGYIEKQKKAFIK